MKTLFISSLVVASTSLTANPFENGGERLQNLIENCEIVGLSSANGGARYAMRNFQKAEVIKVEKNRVFLELDAGEDVGILPKFLSLRLRGTNTTPVSEMLYIDGYFYTDKNKPTQVKGELHPLWFAIEDRVQISFNNEYNLRGAGIVRLVSKGETQPISERALKWDLAIPSSFSKEALCNAGEDVFIR